MRTIWGAWVATQSCHLANRYLCTLCPARSCDGIICILNPAGSRKYWSGMSCSRSEIWSKFYNAMTNGFGHWPCTHIWICIIIKGDPLFTSNNHWAELYTCTGPSERLRGDYGGLVWMLHQTRHSKRPGQFSLPWLQRRIATKLIRAVLTEILCILKFKKFWHKAWQAKTTVYCRGQQWREHINSKDMIGFLRV